VPIGTHKKSETAIQKEEFDYISGGTANATHGLTSFCSLNIFLDIS
jgi:hypothetical protein